MDLLSIDPGKHAFGIAEFEDGQLVGAAYLDKMKAYEFIRTHSFDMCVIELPQIYQQRYWKGDPNDNIHVALAVGGIEALINAKSFEMVTPKRWKGQRPKAVDNKYTLSLLEHHELNRLRGLKSNHNVLDAVGIGLWKLGRRKLGRIKLDE